MNANSNIYSIQYSVCETKQIRTSFNSVKIYGADCTVLVKRYYILDRKTEY